MNAPLLCFALVLVLGCHSDRSDSRLFTLLSSRHTQVTFSNYLEETGDFNIIEYLYYYDGGGVAIGDINEDGLNDLFFTANRGPDKLYLNKGDLVFEDISFSAGIDTATRWSTGVAMADVNGDGNLDIYICQLGDYKGIKGKNQLYINNGDLTFTDRAKVYELDHVGFSTQACFFDYDNDGDLDMYLLNHSVHQERNYGPSTLRLERDSVAGDKLFRNNLDRGEEKFTDVTEDAGIYSSFIGYGLGVTAGDINKDGCIDIFISNDFHENDYLYINNCDGTFTEKLEDMMGHTSRSSMGNDVADFNNDGLLDIVVLDMLPEEEQDLKKSAGEDAPDIYQIKLNFGYCDQFTRNTLQLNMGNGFSEIALLSGIYATDWSWAPLLADFDNDGCKDLFVSNGIPRRPNDLDYLNFNLQVTSQKAAANRMDQIFSDESFDKQLIEKMPRVEIPNKIFRNNNDLTFSDAGSQWGINQPGFSNGAAYGDLDADGDLDLVVNNINREAFIYRNNANDIGNNNYLQVWLVGSDYNKHGIGAKIILKIADHIYYQEQAPVRGFQSSVDYTLHFGVGLQSEIDTLQVIWPDLTTQILTKVGLNQKIVFKKEEADQTFVYGNKSIDFQIFKDISDDSLIDFQHIENQYLNFDYPPLIPHKLTSQGPKLAIGDINGDGLEDLFTGGASHQPANFFIQSEKGAFQGVVPPAFERDKTREDIEAAFFDADGDSDLDLYVVTGGSESWVSREFLRDRLYLNDGNGNFSKTDDHLPEHVVSNGSCVAPADFDQDGDIDLFIGSRSVVLKYGINTSGYLLQNDGMGRFLDITSEIAPDLSGIGMITDAIWTDINHDEWIDLVVVGEWMPIHIFKNSGNKFELVTSEVGLQFSEGWWNTVQVSDVDQDGDDDLLAGNLGLNSKIKATRDEPATIYIKDFDSNGSLDHIVCFYKNGFSVPFPTLDELLKQIPELEEKFPTYNDYAKVRTIEDIFTREELSGALIKKAYEFRSCFIENRGDGTFEINPLPVEAQFSPVFGIIAEDFNKDGKTDILLGGNFFHASVNYGKYDASYGLLLTGEGNGDFRSVFPMDAGFFVKGEIRDIRKIRVANGSSWILVTRNNDRLKIFNWK